MNQHSKHLIVVDAARFDLAAWMGLLGIVVSVVTGNGLALVGFVGLAGVAGAVAMKKIPHSPHKQGQADE